MLVGFVFGAIGEAVFKTTPLLSAPEVHLPPQQILPIVADTKHEVADTKHEEVKEHATEHTSNGEEKGHTAGLPSSSFVLTNTILSSWIATGLIILLFFFGTRGLRADKAPRGLQNFVEVIVSGTFDFVQSVAGRGNARRFFPLIATIFLFVIFNAWLGLLPIYPTLGFMTDNHMQTHLLRAAGTDLNMPLALGLVSFVFVEFWGIKILGFSYFGKFFRFRNLLRGRIFEGLIDVFVGLLETLSEFIRIVSFTFRLFGNMTAGEILLLMTAFLIPFGFSLPFYGLELLVGFIQALIFAGLTLVFVTIAVTSHDAEGGH